MCIQIAIIIRPACIVAALLLTVVAKGQLPATLRFDNLGIDDGLSQSSILHMLQDREGYMWFCTEEGINRYDGYHFKVFKHEAENSASVISSLTFCLHEDSSGVLWAIGPGGISKYLRASETFQPITARLDIVERSLFVTAELAGGVYFFSKGVMYRLDTRSATIAHDSFAMLKRCLHSMQACGQPTADARRKGAFTF